MNLAAARLPTRLPPALLLTPAQMALADAAAGDGTALMAAAGRAVARAVRRGFAPCATLVLCGPGNNGGDGYVAARLLQQAGWPVRLAALAPPRAGSDAAAAAMLWRGPTVEFAPSEAARAGLVIDAVFGAGLTRALPPLVAQTLAAAPRVVAVDVPSGLDGATGQPRGAVRQAVRTITFMRAKPGHFLLPGRSLCGVLEIADIGMPAAALAVADARCWLNLPASWRLPAREAGDHKYSRGHVGVLGGATMTGAARLAAGAARRVGAGLVSIAALGAAAIYRAGEPGLMVSEAPLAALLQDERRRFWVCGPGLGVATAGEVLPPLLAAGRCVVADADALTACAGAPERLRGAAVVTPHAGEFARVFGPPGEDRPAAVRAAAARTGAVVVLKGADSLIAAPDGRLAINAAAPPSLATGGSGDVLAGLIGGLLAQGMPPWEAACAAVWLHGRAAVLAGAPLCAEDLLDWIALAMGEADRCGGPVPAESNTAL